LKQKCHIYAIKNELPPPVYQGVFYNAMHFERTYVGWLNQVNHFKMQKLHGFSDKFLKFLTWAELVALSGLWMSMENNVINSITQCNV